MFGGQNFHDFARGSADMGDLNEIFEKYLFRWLWRWRSKFSGGFGSSFGGFDGFSSGGFGFGGADLDVNAKISIPFDVAVTGGEHKINVNNESIKIKIPSGIEGGEKLRIKGKGKIAGGQKRRSYPCY